MYSGFPADAIPVISIALLFTIVLQVFLYMFSTVVGSAKLTARIKEGFAQMFLTIFIVLFFFVGYGIISSIFTATICDGVEGTVCNHISVAKFSLDLLKMNFLYLYSKLYAYEVVVAVLSSISIPLGMWQLNLFLFSIHITPFAGLNLLTKAHILVVEGMGYAAGVVVLKGIMINFVEKVVPVVLIPFGIAVRAFPFFQKTGSSILALSLALYFALPLAIIFSNLMIFTMFEPTPYFVDFTKAPGEATLCNLDDTEIKENTAHLKELFGENMIGDLDLAVGAIDAEKSTWTKFWDVIFGIGHAITSVVGILISVFKLMFSNMGAEDIWTLAFPLSFLRGFYLYLVNELVLFSQFLVIGMVSTVIEFIFVVTAYRSLSEALGGELEVIGLSKIM